MDDLIPRAFLKDLGGETGVAIGDQLVGKSKTFEQVGHKEVGGSQSGNLLFARNENYPLTKRMVDHDQNRIRAIGGGRQIGNEIHRGMRKEPNIVGGRHRHERGMSGMTINLESLAFKATSNIRFNKGTEARPVVGTGNGSNRGEDTRVTSDSGVVVELQNLAAKAKVSGNVLTAAEIQCCDVVGKGLVPVRVRFGIRKNALGEGVGGVTIGDRMLEIQINEGNKKIVGQQRDVVIIILDADRMIRSTGEGISGDHLGARDIFQQNVVFGQFKRPSGLAGVETLGGTEIGEILMVIEDDSREQGSLDIVAPVRRARMMLRNSLS